MPEKIKETNAESASAPESGADLSDKNAALADENSPEADETLGTAQSGDSGSMANGETPDDPATAAIRDAVLADVKASFETSAEESQFESPSDAFIETEFFDFDYLEGVTELDRVWLNKPYAYVSILHDDEKQRHLYHVTEPKLSEFEEYVRSDLIRALRNRLIYEDLSATDDRTAVFRRRAEAVIADQAKSIDPGAVHKLVYYLLRDFVGLGRIDPILQDRGIEDISCDGADVPVFVYHHSYRNLRTNITLEEAQLNSFVFRLAQRAGKHISVSHPMVDGNLPDGSRIQITFGSNVSARGSNFTIRKFPEVPLTPLDLIRWNTFTVEQMAYFWLAIENNKSLVFAGGTGSGKTSSMNAVSFFIPPDSKVVSIEDTREITLPHDNWIQSVTRESFTENDQGEVTTYQHLQAALRQRPEYIIVGEIRTEQKVALTFFQAIGTGHTAYTTVHADSVDTVLARLQNPPLSVPAQMLRNLDIVSIQKQIYQDDARVRRNDVIAELYAEPGVPEEIRTDRLFRRDTHTDTHERLGESRVLADIADQRGWDEPQLAAELSQREQVLQYLIERGTSDYDEIAGVIHGYTRDSAAVIEQITATTLDPSEYVESQS